MIERVLIVISLIVLADTTPDTPRFCQSSLSNSLRLAISLEDITTTLDMPWYKEWTGKEAKDIKDNVKHVYDELTGKIDHERIGLRPAPLDWRGNPTEIVSSESRRELGTK